MIESEDESTDDEGEDDLFVNKEEKKEQEGKKTRKKKELNMFASQTTMEGWRLTITSLLSLIEDLFDCNYKMVFTGKFNQDPVEVIKVVVVFNIFKFNNKLWF